MTKTRSAAIAITAVESQKSPDKGSMAHPVKGPAPKGMPAAEAKEQVSTLVELLKKQSRTLSADKRKRYMAELLQGVDSLMKEWACIAEEEIGAHIEHMWQMKSELESQLVQYNGMRFIPGDTKKKQILHFPDRVLTPEQICGFREDLFALKESFVGGGLSSAQEKIARELVNFFETVDRQIVRRVAGRFAAQGVVDEDLFTAEREFVENLARAREMRDIQIKVAQMRIAKGQPTPAEIFRKFQSGEGRAIWLRYAGQEIKHLFYEEPE